MQTLIQSYRMRKDPADILKPHPWGRDQIMHNPDASFCCDPRIEMQQVVVILMHRSSQRVLDRYNGCIDFAPPEAHENLVESGKRNNLNLVSQELMDRLLAKRPQLTLNANTLFFHKDSESCRTPRNY
jgi:hypothetical protein